MPSGQTEEASVQGPSLYVDKAGTAGTAILCGVSLAQVHNDRSDMTRLLHITLCDGVLLCELRLLCHLRVSHAADDPKA